MISMKKAVAMFAAVITVIFPMNSCSSKKSSSDTAKAENELTVTFFDVDKADSILLRTDNSTVIIDCGEKGDGKEIVSTLGEQGVDTVDYLIITHYDKDHVGGAAKVIKDLDVKNVFAPAYVEESDEVAKYEKALAEKGIEPTLLTSDVSFELDGISYTINAPEKDYYGEDDDNDFSLVTKVVHGGNTLLFAGDAMEQRLEEIMDIGTCTLLKLPYHGRELANLEEFLNAVQPKCVVVCTSNSEFDSDVQNLLLEKNIPTYSTCFNGKITASSDGAQITMTTEKGI